MNQTYFKMKGAKETEGNRSSKFHQRGEILGSAPPPTREGNVRKRKYAQEEAGV